MSVYSAMKPQSSGVLKPPPLLPGETIGVLAPSMPAHIHFREKYLHGLARLRSLGYNVIEGSLTAEGMHQGYRTAPPDERAAEFMELVLNREVRCIMSAIGGMNSSSLIPYLDFGAIRENPKIVCGYSDITSLHLSILAYSGLSTFYGPAVMPSFGEWPEELPETREWFLDAVERHRSGARTVRPPSRWSNHWRDARTDAWKVEPRAFEVNEGWRVLRQGRVTAPIIAANLNTLAAAAGTGYFPDLSGMILLIEDSAAPMSLEERSLRHLDLVGVFDRIVGLIVGKPEFFRDEGAPFGLDDLILEIIGERNFPIATGFDCSHTNPMMTIAQMTPTTLDCGAGFDVTVTFEEPMIDTGANTD